MRPRGESASWPMTRYVGQKSRHRPQWTHSFKTFLSRSAWSGLDSANVPPWVKRVLRVQPGFERPHKPETRTWIAPHVEIVLERGRAPLNDEGRICTQPRD